MSTGKTLLSITFLVSIVHAFSFTFNSPTECGPFTVSWSGGTPPFSLLVTPVFDNPRNFSIPDASAGSFSVPQLGLKAGQQFIVAMSDSTGFGTGGVSDLLTVGSAVSGVSCDTTIPPTAFQFQLNTLLQQCAPYTISGYDGAVQPVTIRGLIPAGKPIELQPPTGPSSFAWDPVNVATGTSIVFFLTDAAGNFGGSSRINQVGSSANSACINDQSPRSTPGAPAPTGSIPTDSTSTSASPSGSNGAPTATVTVSPPSRISPGTIGGAVVGGLVALLVVGSLLAFWFNQFRNRRSGRRLSGRTHPGGGPPPFGSLQPNSANPFNQSSPYQYGTPAAPWTTFSSTPGADFIAEPWALPSAQTGHSSTAGTTEYGQSDSRNESVRPQRTSKSPPPAQRPTRFILHTDAEEEIELPPQYSDRSTHPNSHAHAPQ